MDLNPGRRLGPYEILGPQGAGGMGEVYRARDTRLDRTVAVKILPADAARDETRRSRFAREARAISALAHPHICTVHDVGSADGVDFLVMELLDGETMTGRLRKGPLPVQVLLRYGIEIADALASAHASGIIHRDLKPDNMIVTKSGVKLLDFGLAQLRPMRHPAPGLATATLPGAPITQAGTILGTLHFMAPEQLEGRVADERTDIFALGNVLYRMAAGRAPFEGGSDAALVGAILQDDPPPIRERRPDMPQPLERLILDCLRKDPAERVQAVHDVKLQLQSVAEMLSAAPPPRDRRRALLPWIAGAAAVAATAVVMEVTRRSDPAAPEVKRFTIDLPALTPGFEWVGYELAISPDGNRVVFSLPLDGARRLHLRSFDSVEFTPLPGTEGAVNPFFSPDGRWIGFTAGGKLKKMLLAGGSPVDVADAPRLRGASWGPDGTIVFAPVSSGDGLYEVSADGGAVRPLTRLDPARMEFSHRWPHVLPDGRHVLYSIDDWGADYRRKQIAVVDRETGRQTTLVEEGTHPRYVDGYLLFARERSLHAIRFDPRTLAVSGLATPVVAPVVTHAGVGSVAADVAADGTLVYVPYDPAVDERTLMWVGRNGAAEVLAPERRAYWSPRLSPDQRQMVVGVGESRATDLWLFDIDSRSWSRVAEEGKSLMPIWSHDGANLFFSNNREGPYNVFTLRSDGTGPARRITSSEHWPFPRTASADGSSILVEEQHPVTSFDIWRIATDGSGQEALLATAANEGHPDFSPDGRWFAYHSTESGRPEVYIQQFPPSGRTWTVSRGGGARPRWSPRGTEIFYWNGRALMAARVSTSGGLSLGPPVALFEGDFAVDYDVTRDADRFVMLREGPRAREGRLSIVLGWPAELARRVAGAQ